MKNHFYKLLLLPFFILLGHQLYANNIIVKGHITDSTGIPKVNWPVNIVIDSSLTPACVQHHTVYTNNNGYYYDTLSCNNTIKQVIISTYDCNYIQVFRTVKPSSNNIVESNFIICASPPVCNAQFNIIKDSVNPKSIHVYAGMNASQGDSVKSRTWYWGDGDSTITIAASAMHSYKEDGIYSVCLSVKTVKGCYSYACDSVEISSKCKASFEYTYLQAASAGYGLRVYSGGSHAMSGDSIINRTWIWGDGSQTVNKDSANAVHYYSTAGNYSVILIIKTKQGCSDSAKQVISIPVGGLQCSASFVFTVDTNKVNFDSHNSYAGVGLHDSIISRRWSFGDSTYEQGNHINITHTYKDTGWYYVCLTIITSQGCENTYCNVVRIEKEYPAHCIAKFTDTLLSQNSNGYPVKFNSNISSPSDGDTIVQRIWHYGDGKIEDGNHVDPTHYYAKPGEYNVCLRIKSKSGCVDSVCNYIFIQPSRDECKAGYAFLRKGNNVQFYSADSSYAASGDSIILRRWNFGDSSIVADSNLVNPSHQYKHAGNYYACLTIKTMKGCENTYCHIIEIVADSIPLYCKAAFTTERLGLLKYRFNSISSTASPGDSIIKRYWNFGDSTYLQGNIINPLKEYKHSGAYTVSLTIQTLKGCVNQTSGYISIKDSLPDDGDRIKIFSLFPNPVPDRFKAVLWSKTGDVKCELSVTDIYGVRKWSRSIILYKGYNIFDIPAATLITGPYYLKASTTYGVKSKAFFKL